MAGRIISNQFHPGLVVAERLGPITIAKRIYTLSNDGRGIGFSEFRFADVNADGDLDVDNDWTDQIPNSPDLANWSNLNLTDDCST